MRAGRRGARTGVEELAHDVGRQRRDPVTAARTAAASVCSMSQRSSRITRVGDTGRPHAEEVLHEVAGAVLEQCSNCEHSELAAPARHPHPVAELALAQHLAFDREAMVLHELFAEHELVVHVKVEQSS